jgi:hypothetical protein
MFHTATRKAMRYGRSFVLTIPHAAAQALNVQRGDMFAVVFDDEQRTLTYQRLFSGEKGPKIMINGQVVDTVVML